MTLIHADRRLHLVFILHQVPIRESVFSTCFEVLFPKTKYSDSLGLDDFCKVQMASNSRNKMEANDNFEWERLLLFPHKLSDKM